MDNVKALLAIAVVVGAVFAANLLTGGGLFAMFDSSWQAPKTGDVGSQAICTDSCTCRSEEHCVDGTCRTWGCVVSSIGRGGCAEGATCQSIDGVGLCVRSPDDPACD